MVLSSDKLNDVLSLFSILILVDGKVYPEEVSVMGNQLNKLVATVDPKILFSPEMGRDWFTSNRKSLSMMLSGDDKQQLIDIALMKLKDLDPKLKQLLIYAMIRISWSDGEYHEKEEDVIQRAGELWNLSNRLIDDSRIQIQRPIS